MAWQPDTLTLTLYIKVKSNTVSCLVSILYDWFNLICLFIYLLVPGYLTSNISHFPGTTWIVEDKNMCTLVWGLGYPTLYYILFKNGP